MKAQKNPLMAWTDYPIGSNDSLKQVEVVRYDRNKYALVKFGEEYESIKSGYLFKDAEMKRNLTAVMLYALRAHDNDHEHTRLEVANTLRKEYRRHTAYTLWVNGDRFNCSSLKAALKKLAPVILKENCSLIRHSNERYSYNSMGLIESEGGTFSRFINHKNRHVLKARHLKEMGVY